MKLLFTHSYFITRDAKQLKAGRPYAPLATLYAMAFMRSNNYEVSLADIQFSEPAAIRSAIDEQKPDVLVIYDDSFNYLVKMCLTNMREAVFEMMKIAGEYNIPVLISSSDATDNCSAYLNQGANYLIIGEAEQTLLQLVQSIEAKESPTQIAGIAYLQNNEVIKTPARAVLKQLDDLPMPAWDLIDLTPYRNAWLKSAGYFSINMVTTRGCPYKCNWCAKPVYGNRYNSHSAKRVAEEIDYFVTHHKIDHIWFADDIFGLKPGFLEEFVQELTKRKLKLPFKIQSRADLLCTEKAVQLLQQAGCSEVWIGAESGSQKILDAMDKGISLKQIEQACTLIKKHDMRVAFFLQFGYSGETWSDIQSTIHMIEKLQPNDIGISVSYPLPGTVFYERVKAELKDKKNWNDSDDLHLMFTGTFSPNFYRVLQRYVHYQFRNVQAKKFLRSAKLNRSSFLQPYYASQAYRYKMKLQALNEVDPATL